MINSNLVQKKITILCWLVILIGFVSINRLDQYTSWIISFAFYYFCVTLKLPNNKSEDKLLFIYLIYLLFEVIRGAIIADGYWEYKNLVTGTLALSMPTMLLIFKNPSWVWFTISMVVSKLPTDFTAAKGMMTMAKNIKSP